MIKIVGMRQGNFWKPYSEEDRLEGYKYHENQPVTLEIKGVNAEKMRSYIHLCTYKGSRDYIASLSLNESMNQKLKVDFMTKINLGFIKETVVLPDGTVQFIPDSLSYENCNHPKSVDFINRAIQEHAYLAGIENVSDYIMFLKEKS